MTLADNIGKLADFRTNLERTEAEVSAKKAPHQKELDAITGEYAEILGIYKDQIDYLRDEILLEMNESGTERVRSAGLLVYTKSIADKPFVDLGALRAHLEASGVLDHYITINVDKVISELGTNLPGITVRKKTSLVVSRDTKSG